nr:MAG TPA: hypothetical protein [Caudoviricetes sp.]
MRIQYLHQNRIIILLLSQYFNTLYFKCQFRLYLNLYIFYQYIDSWHFAIRTFT